MNMLGLSLLTHRHSMAQRDQRLVSAVLLLLTAFLLLLSMVSASIQDHLENNLQAMLGSDMVVSSIDALSESQEESLRKHASAVASTRLLDLNIANGDRWERVQLKVVDDAYPVQGQLTLTREPGGVSTRAAYGPGEGVIWVGSRLFSRLGLRVGQTVLVAGIPLRVDAIVQHEPDRLMEGHSVKMRAIVHEGAISTELLAETAGRDRYLLTASDTQRAAIRSWAERELPDATLLDRHEGSHPLAGYWRRIENFFGLSAVLLFLIAAIAISMATRRQLAAQQHRLALYRSMGVSPLRGVVMALIEWLMAFFMAALPGVVLAYALQVLVVSQLQELFPALEWGWHPLTVLRGLALTLALFLCLQAPVFWALYRTSVICLIRGLGKDSQVLTRLAWTLATLALLTASYSDNWLLTGMVLASMCLAVVLMLCITWLLLWAGELTSRKGTGAAPLLFFIMKNRAPSKAAQVISLGLCATLLLFTLMLMRDIGDSMVSHTRSHNGNLVISDALQEQVPGIEHWAVQTGSSVKEMRSFQRARLTRINDRSPADHAGHPSETLSVVQDEIRLSWSGRTPGNNRVVAGTWWSEAARDWQQVSVEDEVMTDLELDLGDVLTFRAAGRELHLKITARHAVVSGGSSVTFWFIAPPGILEQLPGPIRAMGSMELPDSAWPGLAELLTRYPNMAVVSLQELTRRFDATLAVMTRLTVAYTGMILLLSIAVLLASMLCYEADDRLRNGLLRSMGMSHGACLRLTLLEWLFTGLLAAIGAIAGTWAAGQLIYQSQFQLSYQPDLLWSVGILSVCCALMSTLGCLFSLPALGTSPRQLLSS